MNRCDSIRDLFSAYLEEDLESRLVEEVESHLEECKSCSSFFEDFRDLIGPGPILAQLEEPPYLDQEISSSPCRRWLGLLFSAADREISEANVDRLFNHLESCTPCREAWNDMTLIHQVSEAIEAPQHLISRCLNPFRRRSARRVLGKRTATAAAYFLAILVSLAIGNPVTARYETSTVQKVTEVVGSEVSNAAQAGKGEVRVMLWRALSLGQRTADAVRTTWNRMNNAPAAADDANENKESSS